MMHEIKVTVVDYNRRYLMLRYIDPMTGKQKHKSAKTTNKRAADKAAGVWEDELRSGRYAAPCKTIWADFRERYEAEVLPGLADNTGIKVGCVFDSVEAILSPNRLVDVTEQRVSAYQAKLRDAGKAESTIKSNLAHLKAALRWAERIGMLVKAPRIAMPKRAKSSRGSDPMKGRPITLEEFERMLKATRKVVGRTAAKSWRQYLRGLWLSGLRLAESLELSWDDSGKLSLDLSGRYPMLRINAEAEKGNRDRLLPLAPDFATWLQRTPAAQRTGPVFNPLSASGKRASSDNACRTVTAIGEKAGVKVRAEGVKVKFASAHDLRRSFGERWAVKVMPQVLQQLMRHETIDTTLRFYVGRNADTMARALWEAHSITADRPAQSAESQCQPASR